MSTERKGLEIYVGLFLFIGLATIAVMVIVFGRVGEGFVKTYPIVVEFPNASGLIKDSYVLLSGAQIGKVTTTPKLTGSMFAVEVTLNIHDDVKLPRDSRFLVGSSGLLGDRFVDVFPPEKFDPTKMIEPNDRIQGTRATGLDDLTAKGAVVMEKGAVVMDQLIKELEDIQKITVQLHSGLLSEQNMKNLTETFANLKTTSTGLNESMKKLDPIMAKADSAVDSAKGTMKTAEEAAAEFKKVAANAGKTMDSAKGLVDSGKTLFDKANRGDGALGMLLSDRETADNLRALIANMRRSGVVFYKDREPKPVPAPTPIPRIKR